jgi:thiol:disulfide interchange protein DsbC
MRREATMTTRPLAIIALASAALFSPARMVCAESPDATPEQQILSTLRQRYPATVFTRVRSTPIRGLYEVVLGRSVAYTAEDGRYFVFGHLFDLATQRDLTVANAPPPTPVDFAALPLVDAIKTVRGTGRRALAVFSDPDCPYCRELEAQLTALDDATVYTFLLPLASLHPQATVKAIAVWCARDRPRAWRSVVLERKTLPFKTCPHPIERNLALAEKLQVRGTPTLIAADGRMTAGVMSAAELAAWLDAGAEANGSAAVPEDRP